MVAGELDVLTPEDGIARSNTGALKGEEASMQLANGDEESNVSELHNGNEGPPISVEHKEEDDTGGNIPPVKAASPPMGPLEASGKDCSAHSITNAVEGTSCTQKMADDADHGLSVVSNCIGKSETSSGKKSPHIELSTPAFRKPLDMGWKRELVFRNLHSSSQITSDVYYHTPTGQKVRSFRELGKYLRGTDLTKDNFTFLKAPLDIDDPDKEIIRGARQGRCTKSFDPVPHKIQKVAEPPELDGIKMAASSEDAPGKEDRTRGRRGRARNGHASSSM